MKKLLTVALILTAQAHGSSGVNCNGMTAGPIWQNSGVPSAPSKPNVASPAPRNNKPGQR